MGWLVVCSKPNAEVQAYGSFIRNGWNCFLPRVRGKKDVLRPLFPRYLFLEEGKFDPVTAQYQPGVSYMLRTASDEGSFARIGSELIAELKEAVARGLLDERQELVDEVRGLLREC